MNVFDYFFENTKNLDKDFVIGNKETISYKNLYQNSLRIASYLNENIGVDNHVILISQNSVFFITAYLGILKSGNICVPLDFTIEQENLDFISKITESKMIFSDERSLSRLNYKNFREVIDEDKFDETLEYHNVFSLDKIFDSQNLAEIIFTSGSTGKPKG
ncbi:MAG: AMP-binding protein, partial [Flavobacteriaceae bacterium]|nr:AMP-binding protein [Flavobacteriaceae bacterium]